VFFYVVILTLSVVEWGRIPMGPTHHNRADPGAYVATVNGVVTGQHKAWGAFDWEEIGPLLKVTRDHYRQSVRSTEARLWYGSAQPLPAAFLF
jgi:hypothetical protein